MWNAIAYVSGGATLAAFVAAVAAWIYRRKLAADAELIRTAPESERARLVMARHGVLFDVDTEPLTKQQKVDTINRQIAASASQFRTVALIVVLIAILAALVTAFAIAKSSHAVVLETRLEERGREIDTVRKQLQPTFRTSAV